MKRLALLAAAATLALTACSGSGGVEATSSSTTTPLTTTSTSTSSTSTTTTSSTTTTTLPTGPPSPINGLPLGEEEEDLLARRVLAVKVDNHPQARPQSGLQEADGVIEIIVEGGFTRLIALFHQSDSEYVGPVRSVRPTDSAVLAPLGATLAISGGQAWIAALANDRGVPLIGEGFGGLFRVSHRRAPHNLYGDTMDLRAVADAREYEDDFDGPLYDIGEWTEPEENAETIDFDWALGHTVTWIYEDGRYLRFEGTSSHDWVDQTGQRAQLAFDVLVVIEGHQYNARPTGAISGNSVPAVETLGTGRLLIFAHGKVMEGTWERDEVDQPYRFFDADGNPTAVPPGIPWICLFPQERTVDWS